MVHPAVYRKEPHRNNDPPHNRKRKRVDDLKTPDDEEGYQADLRDSFQRTFRDFILAHGASLHFDRA